MNISDIRLVLVAPRPNRPGKGAKHSPSLSSRTLPYLILPYLIPSYPILAYSILFYLSYTISSYLNLIYLILSILSYLILSCLILFYLMLSYLIFLISFIVSYIIWRRRRTSWKYFVLGVSGTNLFEKHWSCIICCTAEIQETRANQHEGVRKRVRKFQWKNITNIFTAIYFTYTSEKKIPHIRTHFFLQTRSSDTR